MVLMGWCSLMSICEVGWGQDNDPKHTVKPTMWMSFIGPAWARAPIKCLRREVQITVHWPSPSNLSDLERICREEWYTIPASRCAKLLVSYPSRFEAVTGVKGASTVSFFFFHNVAKLSKILFSLYYYEVLSIANSSDFSNKKKWGKNEGVWVLSEWETAHCSEGSLFQNPNCPIGLKAHLSNSL